MQLTRCTLAIPVLAVSVLACHHSGVTGSMGGGVVSYSAGGRQRIGVATGMKSPIWPGGSSASQIVVYGLR